MSLFTVGKSVVVYKYLQPGSGEGDDGTVGILRPRSLEKSALDWEGGELLHCAPYGNCNRTERERKVTALELNMHLLGTTLTSGGHNKHFYYPMTHDDPGLQSKFFFLLEGSN